MMSTMNQLRTLASAIGPRAALAAAMGKTFGGLRDVAKVLGYKNSIGIEDYRLRFRRNPIASRVVRALPQATWRGGGEIIEDDTTPTMTPFETQWDELATRLRLWRIFWKADVLSGLNRHGGILIGAPGRLDSELDGDGDPNDVVYFKAYADDVLLVNTLEDNTENERFGLPRTYKLKPPKEQKIVSLGNFEREVHWSRVIHVCDELEDDLYAAPRLECVWDRLDDLDKVTGGGAEAFWLRAHQGMQVDVDKEIELDPEKENALDKEVDEYLHAISRVMRTRGTKVTTLGSDTADFKNPVAAIIAQICSGSGIPQRILMGSERGELASTQDRDNWFDQVADRRSQFAHPNEIKQLTDRLITYNFLKEPAKYDTRWSQLKGMDEGQKADLAIKITTANKYQGETIITSAEIRDRVWGMPELTEAQKKEEAEKVAAKIKPTGGADPSAPKGSRRDPALGADRNQVRAAQ